MRNHDRRQWRLLEGNGGQWRILRVTEVEGGWSSAAAQRSVGHLLTAVGV